jgi:hypothetical protein
VSNRQPPPDWRTVLSIEERLAVRHKIKTAYTNSCGTYEDLLDTVIAMEEELLHLSAASRLDYFGKGYKYENIVRAKRKQLDGTK